MLKVSDNIRKRYTANNAYEYYTAINAYAIKRIRGMIHHPLKYDQNCGHEFIHKIILIFFPRFNIKTQKLGKIASSHLNSKNEFHKELYHLSMYEI
mgnify:FL=1